MSNEKAKSVAGIIGAACILMTSPTARAQKACGLLSRQQIERAMGTGVGEGRPGVRSGMVTTCSFAISDGGRLSILLRRHPSPDWMAEQQQRMHAPGRFQPIAASRGRSFALDLKGAGAAICHFRDDYYLQISIVRAGASHTVLPKAEMLSRTALNRLH